MKYVVCARLHAYSSTVVTMQECTHTHRLLETLLYQAHLPRIGRERNAILKTKTYDPFCYYSFQSLKRKKLLKLDLI